MQVKFNYNTWLHLSY